MNMENFKGPENTVEANNYSIEKVKENFAPVIGLRDSVYEKEKEGKESMFKALEKHNEVVLNYCLELIEADKNKLTNKEKSIAISATIWHDSAKLSANLLNHHEAGAKYAKDNLSTLVGKTINGVVVDENMVTDIENAIRRHQNHPFLVKLNKGERFEEPQTLPDKIVFDADMLANANFKNVAFRLMSEDFLKQDKETAGENGSRLEVAFLNVMEGVDKIEETVLTPEAKVIAKRLAEEVRSVFEYLKKEGTIAQLEKEYFGNEKFYSKETESFIKDEKGQLPIIGAMNEAIDRATNECKECGISIKERKFFGV